MVGSSGGIDSAVVLALAAEAYGPENVIAVTMPSRVSSEGSVDDSIELCKNLGIRLFTHPIEPLVGRYKSDYYTSIGDELNGLALENLQARIRATILMSYSNKTGKIVLTTGNKSELAVGYCTLGGDMMGGYAPISDLYKTEVWALAEEINQRAGKALIAVAIIDKPPSAELYEGQNEFKRRMADPGVRVHRKAFGAGRCLPIAQRCRIDVSDCP